MATTAARSRPGRLVSMVRAAGLRSTAFSLSRPMSVLLILDVDPLSRKRTASLMRCIRPAEMGAAPYARLAFVSPLGIGLGET